MTTSLVSMMWIVWATVAVVTACLYAYRSSLTRDEEGQIFLDEAFNHEKAVQEQIVSRVNRLQPIAQSFLVLTVLLSLLVLGFYGWTAARALVE